MPVRRISDFYGLGRDQSKLDFVDVDIEGDTPLFVDPRALRLVPTPWGHECVSLIQNFFRAVLVAIRDGRMEDAAELLAGLSEPNETHLGLSTAAARGNAMGEKLAIEVRDSLASTDAATSGHLEDLEETALLVPNVDRDRISDITTNVIRGPLIRYTQLAAEHYEIPLHDDVDSGPLWDPTEGEWTTEAVQLPVTDAGKLLLVPKAIVRRRLDFRSGEYLDHYLLPYIQEAHMSAGSELVCTLQSGEKRPPTKKTLKELYGTTKPAIARLTRDYPEALDAYRAHKDAHIAPPLTHEEFFDEGVGELPDFDALLEAVRILPAGNEHATEYERAIEDLLTALFYPGLTSPIFQTRLHNGRKIVDITFSNVASKGFFAWLLKHYPSAQIFVECKNYREDPANPELDQLSGRFGINRGRVGFLVCRTVDDKVRMAQRCRDTSTDDRGFMIVLDDDDLETLVDQIKSTGRLQLLKDRFDALI